MTERPHQKLTVWKESIQLVRNVYDATQTFPREEVYALTSQIRRAAVSVVSNIAEGAARWSMAEKVNFYRMARGSLSELETQVEISLSLNYLSLSQHDQLLEHTNQIGRMLNGLIAFKRSDRTSS